MCTDTGGWHSSWLVNDGENNIFHKKDLSLLLMSCPNRVLQTLKNLIRYSLSSTKVGQG